VRYQWLAAATQNTQGCRTNDVVNERRERNQHQDDVVASEQPPPMQVPLGLAKVEVSLLHLANELLGVTTYLDLLLLYVVRDLVQRFAGAAEEDVTLHHAWRVLAHQGQRLVQGTTPPNG